MPDLFNPEISRRAQPKPEDFSFDLQRALSAMVSVRSKVPDDALTATALGRRTAGHGVVIRADGLVLTVGYLITEADSLWLADSEGNVFPGHVVGYDQETGLGLAQAMQRLQLPALELGDAAEINVADNIILAGHGGRQNSLCAQVIGKQEFAGYWEYVLDEAISPRRRIPPGAEPA